MKTKKLLVLSNGKDPKELDPLKKHLKVEIRHLVIVNRDYKNIKIPEIEIIDGIFFATDIDASDIGEITRELKLEIPMVRALSQIHHPVEIEGVETCEDVSSVVSHFEKIFSKN